MKKGLLVRKKSNILDLVCGVVGDADAIQLQ